MDDYDFPPKKRITTYGKAARRRAQGSSIGSLKSADSTTEVSATSSVASTSHSGSPEPAPRPRPPTSSSTTKLTSTGPEKGTSRRSRPASKAGKEATSQPLPSTVGLGYGLEEDEDTAVKKRKLRRTYSEQDADSMDDLYAIPDSPPPRMRPAFKRAPASIAEEVTPKPTRVAKRVDVARILGSPNRDVDMEDADATETLFSAKTSRTLDRFSVSRESPPTPQREIPLRPSRGTSVAPLPPNRKRPSPPPLSSKMRSTMNPGPRKKRLIDALVEQAESDGSEEEDSEAEEQQSSLQQLDAPTDSRPTDSRPTVVLNFRDSTPPSTPKAASNAALSTASAKTTGPKFTYSERRTMLKEDAFLGGTGLGGIEEEPANGSIFDFGRLAPTSTSNFSFLDEDDETVNTGAVRSLHELRQAGANSRFADEIDDIMDRIGSPSAKMASLRRGALLELAQKLMKKQFRQQFRDHGDNGTLLRSVGEETDTISGYSILAILVTLLAASSSAHIVQQLRSHNFAALLARLLGEPADIAILAKDRKQNASRNAQNTLRIIKSSLLALPIWEPCSPTLLSPRTLALKCLDLIVLQPHHSSGESEIFSPAVTDVLFSILSTAAASETPWDFPARQDSIDLYFALYMLESKSISAMQSSQGARWTRQYVPIAANLLEKALRTPVDKLSSLENLALRLALNTTNNNLGPARMFTDQGLLQELAVSACDAFDAVLNSMRAEAFLKDVYESLIMMLGVMVNFVVYYPPASRALEHDVEEGSGGLSSLDRLIRIFADHHLKTSDADSIEKTQLNVALGYLSILLGYLCTHEPIRERFLVVHPKKTMEPLLDSIHEFIAVNHKAAEASQSQFGATARLQHLLAQLGS